MSAFVMNNADFDALASTLWHRYNEHNWTYLFNRHNVWSENQAVEMVRSWRNLNIEAVNQRYNAKDEYDLSPLRPSFRLIVSDAALFGILDCLRYQCSEGDVPESDLYKQLSVFANHAASVVASSHPDYHWGLKHEPVTA